MCPECFAEMRNDGSVCDSCGWTSDKPPRDRMYAAMQLIEESQRMMLSAAHELCPVHGACPEWEATLKMYDKIKAHWHKVSRRRFALQQKHKQPAKAS